jgi:hypothetical protein
VNTLTRSAFLVAGTLAITAAGCAKTETPAATSGTTPTTTAAGGPALSGATPVAITMTEWKVAPSSASAPAGKVTFTAKNDGVQTHELVLFKTDLAPDKLPLDEEGAVDERGAGIELIDEVEDVEAGTSKSFEADLKPGNYLLVCNLVDKAEKHFEHKMYAPFTVK